MGLHSTPNEIALRFHWQAFNWVRQGENDPASLKLRRTGPASLYRAMPDKPPLQAGHEEISGLILKYKYLSQPS
jgi:hypothetical protein